MRKEVVTTVNYIKSFLFNNLPRLRVEAFGEAVASLLMVKLAPHWHPEQPCHDVQYRCLRVTGPNADPLLSQAAQQSGLLWQEIISCLPQEELCIWIDPGEVTARIGSRGETIQLLQAPHDAMVALLPSDVSIYHLGVQTDASYLECCLFNDKSTSSNSSCSPSISPTAILGGGRTHPSNSESSHRKPAVSASAPGNSLPPFFTAASFAQTKFGSTKLRSPTKTATQSSAHHPNRHSLLSLPPDCLKSAAGPYGNQPFAPLVSRPMNLPISNDPRWFNKNLQHHSPMQGSAQLNAVHSFVSPNEVTSFLLNEASANKTHVVASSTTRPCYRNEDTAHWLSYLKTSCNEPSPSWNAQQSYEEQSLRMSSVVTSRMVTPLLGFQSGSEEVN